MSTSLISLVSAVNVAPSFGSPVNDNIPVASSSTFCINLDVEIKLVVPPLSSFDTAVNRMYLST